MAELQIRAYGETVNGHKYLVKRAVKYRTATAAEAERLATVLDCFIDQCDNDGECWRCLEQSDDSGGLNHVFRARNGCVNCGGRFCDGHSEAHMDQECRPLEWCALVAAHRLKFYTMAEEAELAAHRLEGHSDAEAAQAAQNNRDHAAGLAAELDALGVDPEYCSVYQPRIVGGECADCGQSVEAHSRMTTGGSK